LGITDASLLRHPGVRRVSLHETTAACAMPLGHRLADRETVGAEDLIAEPFIAFSRRLPVRASLDLVFSRAGVERDIVAETTTSFSACQLVMAGIGICVLNPCPVLPWFGNRIVFRPFTPTVHYSVSAMLPSGGAPSRLARAFIADLKKLDITVADHS